MNASTWDKVLISNSIATLKKTRTRIMVSTNTNMMINSGIIVSTCNIMARSKMIKIKITISIHGIMAIAKKTKIGLWQTLVFL